MLVVAAAITFLQRGRRDVGRTLTAAVMVQVVPALHAPSESLVEQVVSPLRGGHGANSRARADDTAQEITAVALRLHAALVRAGLVRAGLG